jgi:hypothetical protein
MRLFLGYIQEKQNNNFEMTSFANERRLNSFLFPRSLYESQFEIWNNMATSAISRGLHLKPFDTLTDEERHQLGKDAQFIGTHSGFTLTDEHVNDPQFMRGYRGQKFISTDRPSGILKFSEFLSRPKV